MSLQCAKKQNLQKIVITIFATCLFFYNTQLIAECSINTKPQSKKQTITQQKTEEKQEKNIWKQSFHISTESNNFDNLYAITKFNDEYHLFYSTQKNYDDKSKNVWSHITSKDLINWKHLKNAIEPSNKYDENNIFGGSTIIDDDLLYILYSGEYKTIENDKDKVYQTQNLAMSKDGWNFGKSANNPVIAKAPNYSYLEFSQSYFNSPFVWKLEDRYYALVGSQYLKGEDGAVLLFKSKDLRNWTFINVTALGQNKEMGEFWGHPALLHINKSDILAFSAKGIKPHEKMFLNKNQSGAIIGNLNYDTGKFTQKSAYMLFDYGFDFYAPKFTKTEDNRYIFIANLGMEDTPSYENSKNKVSVFTIPRELNIKNGKLITTPAKEVLNLRSNKINIKNEIIISNQEYADICGDVYELDMTVDMTKSNKFILKLRKSPTQETIITYDKETKKLTLNRDKSGYTETEIRLQGEREANINLVDNKLKLHIFVDKSSVELFVNDGEIAMSSRIYPDKNATGIQFESLGEAIIENLDFYKLKTLKTN